MEPKNSKDEKLWRLEIIWKPEFGKLFTKWGLGKLSSKSGDEEMGGWHVAQMWPCIRCTM